MSEVSPDDRRLRSYMRIASAAVVLAAVIAVGAAKPNKKEQPKPNKNIPAQAAKVRLASQLDRLGTTGGVLLDYTTATGVDCSPTSKRKITRGQQRGKYYLNTQNGFEWDPNFNETVEFGQYKRERTIYAGLDRGSGDFVNGYGGYYPLISGFAIRHAANTSDYELLTFSVQPDKDQYLPGPAGKIVGDPLLKFTTTDLALGNSYSYEDGSVSVTVAGNPITSFPPDLVVNISCYPSQPMITTNR